MDVNVLRDAGFGRKGRFLRGAKAGRSHDGNKAGVNKQPLWHYGSVHGAVFHLVLKQ